MNKYKIILTFVIGILAGSVLNINTNVSAESASAHNEIPLEGLKTFSQIFQNIKNNYVEEVSDEELINNAISGMVSNLDPHSAYLLPDNFKDLTVSTTGKFGGLGIEVGMQDGFVKVISPIDDTPAMKAGVEAGDLIIKIDNKSVQGMKLNDAVKLMRGEVGTPIKITIVRKGKDKPFVIKIIRDTIKIKSVRSRLLEPKFGYIRISQFQLKTASNLRDEIKKLVKKNNNKELEGLVLDLRNNPGGLLKSAVEVSNAFINKGTIVYTEGRTALSKSRFNATKETLINGVPLVVIINNGSASASEIVAGALQDHKRAIIVGSKSFGKGSVQTVIPLSAGSGLKITTALYYTPNGRSIQAKGIIPDISIKPIKIASTEDSFAKFSISEKDLSGHLENANKKNKESSAEQSVKKSDVSLIKTDFVLHEALNLLKGAALFK